MKANITKYLWEINSNFHCSIIGTCLTLDEVRNCFKKQNIKDLSNYHIHCLAVHNAATKNSCSIKMQKKLEAKFSKHVEKHFEINNSEKSYKLFLKDSKSGDVAGNFWAIMTLNHITREVFEATYGKVHILSHINGEIISQNNDDLQYQREKVNKLEKKQKYYKKEIKSLKDELKNRNKIIQKNNNLQMQLDKIANEKNVKNISETSLYKLNNKIHKLNITLDSEIKKNCSLTIAQKELYQEIDRQKEINQLLKKELFLMRSNYINYSHISQKKTECQKIYCSKTNCEFDLCGKCILYVGGKTSLIQHYRSVVESNGGRFVYHDGGKENSFSRLPKLLSCADKIFCPLDMISHTACQFIKNKCKKYKKDMILLNSSGVSTFSRELEKIS